MCYAVILEVDEHQHKIASYSTGCELSRVADIVQSYGGIPIHMIRFNPDAFRLKGINKTKRNCKETYRFEILKKVLESALRKNDFAKDILTIEWLFYDNKDGREVQTLTFETLKDYASWANNQAQ